MIARSVHDVSAADASLRSPEQSSHRSALQKPAIAALFAWTLAVTALRAVRLPNDFSKAHWLVDYRFGPVKRGLVGTVVTLITAALHTRATGELIDFLSSSQFVIFCIALMCLALRLVVRAAWSPTMTLASLVFLSSPFVVMSAHLVGYFDNIVVLLTIGSVALLLTGRLWSAAILQSIAILVHENSLVLGYPVFVLTWLLLNRRNPDRRLAYGPLLLPVFTFLLLALSQSFASRHLERSLMRHMSTYPFVQDSLQRTQVPHWIAITLFDSYLLHRGLVASRLLSTSMLGVILPSTLSILGITYDAFRIPTLSRASIVVLIVCVVAQSIHVVAWDTSRTWTYAILAAFFVLWVYTEVFGAGNCVSGLVPMMALLAIVLNALTLTPLMDGLSDRLALTTRELLYAPVFASALALIWAESSGSVRRADSPTPV